MHTYRHIQTQTAGHAMANAVLLRPHSLTPIHISLPIHKHTHSTLIHSFIHFISFISVIEAAHEHIRIHRIHRSDAKRSDARTANPTIDRSSKRTLLSTL
eukprot:GHVU01175773.1.p2 GENE.GHVU01175773.1~~GHVU01175773.1.p2  ORF type:complete len:100 (-),score=4.91 GHVU01175773.1:201-500(-)